MLFCHLVFLLSPPNLELNVFSCWVFLAIPSIFMSIPEYVLSALYGSFVLPVSGQRDDLGLVAEYPCDHSYDIVCFSRLVCIRMRAMCTFVMLL